MRDAANHRRDHSFAADDGSLTKQPMNQTKKRGRPAKVRQEQSIEAEAVNDQREVEIDIEVQPVEDDGMTLVRRVEMEIGRTSNAWGMVDPVELIDAVRRVIKG